MRLLLNLLWFVLGGWLSGLLWLFAGAVLAITVIGLPYTGAAWRIAGFAAWPFGKTIIDRPTSDLGTGPVGCVLNVIWFVLAGWYLALSHVLIAIAEAVTLIGIPFAFKDLQLAGIALAPIGKDVVKA